MMMPPEIRPHKTPLTPVVQWLWLCAGMIFIMALIGAITRLTESGLSIAEWKPLLGTLPPLSDAEWQRVFALYQQTPEYLYKNQGMTIEAFKSIFWWEWGHRLWGRLIGFVFALPLLWFIVTKRLSKTLAVKLFAILALGGLQGGIGWFMVASGLIDRPSVSHYRLALHLSMAVLLMTLIIYQALKIAENRPFIAAPQGVRRHACLALAMAAVTVVWGAFVAGLDAGMVYNEFPLMGGHILPPDALHLSPIWLNFIENPVAVQFTHRWLAIFTALVVFFLGLEMTRSHNVSLRAHRLGSVLMAMVIAQVSLGIATLLTQVNIVLAALHQGGALILIGLLTASVYELRRQR